MPANMALRATRARVPDVAVTWAVLALAAAIRIAAVRWDVQSFHPDELYQYLEQAHRIAFGYGFIPWEAVEGIRNPLLPTVLAAIMGGFDRMGLGGADVYIPAIQALAVVASLSVVAAGRGIAAHLGGRDAGVCAAILLALCPPLVAAATDITPEVWGAYAFLMSLAVLLNGGRGALLGAGALAGVTVGLRLQYAPLVAVEALAVVVRAWEGGPPQAGRRVSSAATTLAAWSAGGGIALAAFGAADWAVLGVPFVSYIRAVQFNITHGVADLFGRSDADFYVWPLMMSGALPIGLLALVRPRAAWLPLAAAVALVGVHMLIGHKEERFVFAAQPLLLIAGAVTLATWWPLTRMAAALVVAALLGVVAQDALTRPDGLGDYRRAWAVLRREPQVAAIAFAHRNNDFFRTLASAYELHRNVPMVLLKTEEIDRGETPAGVSHLIAPKGQTGLSGFGQIAIFGDVAVYRRVGGVGTAQLPPYTWYIQPPWVSGDDALMETASPHR